MNKALGLNLSIVSPGMGAHACRLGMHEDQKFKIILGYVISLRPAWERPCYKQTNKHLPKTIKGQ